MTYDPTLLCPICTSYTGSSYEGNTDETKTRQTTNVENNSDTEKHKTQKHNQSIITKKHHSEKLKTIGETCRKNTQFRCKSHLTSDKV